MLERVVVKGFQSHIDTDITFSGGINLVRGDNASGKSALRRALLWVLTNKPTGTSFINWGLVDTDVCEVTVYYNGHIVSRRRSRNGKVNEYILDGNVLSGFGVNVPEPITAVLSLDDTNVELQHSALFMLSESPPEMARRLNKLTNLEDIDKAFSSMRSRKLENSKEIKRLAAKESELATEVEKYAFLEDAGTVVEGLEEAHGKMTTAYDDAQTASGMVTTFTAESSKIRLVPDVSVSQIERALTVAKEKQAEHSSADSLLLTINSLYVLPVPKGVKPQMLQEARDKVIQLGMELKTLNMFVDDMNNQKILSPSPISSKEINFDTIRKCIDAYRETQVLITDMEHLTDSLIAGEFRLEKLMSDYEVIKPATCPLCGSEYGGKHEDCNVG